MPETEDGIGNNKPCPAIRLIIQRYRHAKLLIDENKVLEVGTPCGDLMGGSSDSSSVGLLVYISFAKTATKPKVEQAAKTLLNLPVLTMGAWGDGTGTKSILQLSADEYHAKKKTDATQSSSTADDPSLLSPLSILLVPQANLISKVKKLGKSIQYRDQIDKSQGQAMYEFFGESIEQLLVEHYEGVQKGGGLHTSSSATFGSSTNNNKKQNTNANPNSTPDLSIPPSRLFHQDDTYGSFEEGNDQTFPLTYANGEPLTKSARKKLQKIYHAHVQRHAKYLLASQQAASGSATERNEVATTAGQNTPNDLASSASGAETAMAMSASPPDVAMTNMTIQSKPKLDPSFVQLVAGTFGKRQGLEIQSDMGPFCHVVEID